MKPAVPGAGATQTHSDTQTHYQTLGVRPSASGDEIRRAYRGLARKFHPDHHHGVSPLEAKLAQRRMAELNAAWSVLSDKGAKDRYDLELALAKAQARRAAAPRPPARPVVAPSATPGSDEGAETDFGVWNAVFHAGPWLLVILLLGGIFVFTAFAATGPENDGSQRGTVENPIVTPVPAVGDCVRFPTPTEIDLVDCARSHQGQVIEVVPIGRPCRVDTTQTYLPTEHVYVCILRT